MDTVQEESGSPISDNDDCSTSKFFPPSIPLISITREDNVVKSTLSLPSQSVQRSDPNCSTSSQYPRREEIISIGMPKASNLRRGSQRGDSISLLRTELPVPPNAKVEDMSLQVKGESSAPGTPNFSRRHSAIIAALRRPSQAIALSAAQAVMAQRKYILGIFNGESDGSIGKREEVNNQEQDKRRRNKLIGDDSLTIILSALYAKLLVVLGIAFPITEIISPKVKPFFYQGFYLYLYLGSMAFVTYMYCSLLREKAVLEMINSYSDRFDLIKKAPKIPRKYGSFYLRLGAIAFGIGSMVYSGLDFGKYFEQKNIPGCKTNILEAITPAIRMLLTLVQIQFIFLNSKDVQFNRHRIIARFGLMHMVATNLCEWLYVLVEETRHEIIHLGEHHNKTSATFQAKICQEGMIMGHLVSNSSPFLFPCTIEYSLICAVILFEIWKEVKLEDTTIVRSDRVYNKMNTSFKDHTDVTHFHFNANSGRVLSSNHHFTVDCSNAHRGLFTGIMVIVLTIISLIMFFVLSKKKNGHDSQQMALYEVSIVELLLYIITTIAVIIAMMKLRCLKYDRKIEMGESGGSHKGHDSGIGLDNTLLVVAQTGMFIYCMFSIIGCYFMMDTVNNIALVTEVCSLIQTCLQTIFVLDGWWRRCRNLEQTKKKPGREIITFLIVANMAMWTINTLEKNRAEFRPSHLNFFGDWAWTIITHISMPLAIFYRFHSTICLFEIWKSAYKIKTHYKGQLFPEL